MLPGSDPDKIAAHLSWIKPHFFDEATGDIGSRIQTWVVRTRKHTTLVDTGVGNDKHRAENPIWHLRQGMFLDDLKALGGGVDYVLCTHMHIDHVGWNTLFGNLTVKNLERVIHRCEWGRDDYSLQVAALPPAPEPPRIEPGQDGRLRRQRPVEALPLFESREWEERHAMEPQVFDRITIEPGKMNGQPCIRGLRLTVRRARKR